MSLAIGASEFSFVLLATILIVVPIAAVAFARSGKALEELGKGRFFIDRDDDLGGGLTAGDPATSEKERAEEVRQMVEAADFRSQARGEGRVDVEREIERLLAGGQPEGRGDEGTKPDAAERPGAAEETGLRAEVRQLVVANNERRARRGEAPLDVEFEVQRRMDEWS